ncbi:hypothetical protein CRUP_024751 [Coryphaenoides rupestris]|nr:hypothetical protein CRUP_024751 [Coryphaenoides rupestris]
MRVLLESSGSVRGSRSIQLQSVRFLQDTRLVAFDLVYEFRSLCPSDRNHHQQHLAAKLQQPDLSLHPPRCPGTWKGTVVNSTVLVFIASVLMGYSRALGSPEMVVIGRFITGIHSGISLSVVPMYLGEIAPKNLRGFLGLVPSIFICVGVFAAQVLGLHELLGKEEHWPPLLSLIAVPTFIQLMLLPWFPRVPVPADREDNVHATITDMYRVPVDHTSLKEVRHRGRRLTRNSWNALQEEIEEMQEEQRSLSSVDTLSVWQLLLDGSVRWQVLSVVVINIGMQLPADFHPHLKHGIDFPPPAAPRHPTPPHPGPHGKISPDNIWA